LRDSAGISPDFADVCDPRTVHTNLALTKKSSQPAAANFQGACLCSGSMSQDPLTDDPRPDGLRSAPSLVLINTGNGKGKSSSAFGVMLRALALDWPVAVVQFIKSGDWKVGEESMGRKLGVDWYAFGDGFTWDSNNLETDQAHAATGWNHAAALIAAGDHRLIILDELTYLCTWGWLDVNKVVTAITERPAHVNIVITGRDAPEELIAVADTVTEMKEIKHAYQQGIRAKRGIDY
jgi:cob(I)alamin adenosyltransferase